MLSKNNAINEIAVTLKKNKSHTGVTYIIKIYRTAFFTVHRDVEKEQNMITKNRQIHKTCTGSHLARITGLKLCGEIQFPNASLETSAPYFPLTGPISLDVSLMKEDSHKSYNVEARFSKVINFVFCLLFFFPGIRFAKNCTNY